MGFLDYAGLARFKQKLDVLFAGKLDTSLKGVANGLAELDSTGKVVSSQLPDIGSVIEVASYSNLPATGAEHTIYITTDTNESYRWDTNHYDKIANPNDMVGASGSLAGTSGLVPAPGIGAQNLFLRGDGIWEEATGAKLVPVELTVTNTSGVYTTTVQDSEITSDMKPVVLEINNPSIFNDEIIVTCNNGSITLSCDDVAGTSLVKVNVMKQAPSTIYITSDEYNALDQSKVDKNQGTANAGKILGINSSGMVAPVTAGGLPPVTAADNGKFCMVVNGDWAAASIPAARGVSF